MVYHDENDKINDRIFYGFLIFFSLVTVTVCYMV